MANPSPPDGPPEEQNFYAPPAACILDVMRSDLTIKRLRQRIMNADVNLQWSSAELLQAALGRCVEVLRWATKMLSETSPDWNCAMLRMASAAVIPRKRSLPSVMTRLVTSRAIWSECLKTWK